MTTPIALIPLMTSNTAPSGVASSNVSNEVAYWALDGVDSTEYSAANTSTNAWLQYKFTEPKRVTKIEITPGKNASGVTRVKNFTLQASNDNFASDTHDLLTDIVPNNSIGITRSFDVPNTNKYLYYRLFVKDTWVDNRSIQIHTLQMYGR